MAAFPVALFMVVAAACGETPGPGVDGSAPTAGVPDDADSPVASGGSQGGALVLSGIIDLTAETADLNAARRLPSRREATPDGGPFQITLEDERGDEVAHVHFEPLEPSPESDGPLVAHFSLGITDALPPLTRATVTYRGQVLGTREAGPTVPTVQIVSPGAGDDVSYWDATFAWEGDDGDGDDLVYHVLLTLDGGDTWRSLGAGTDRTEITLEPGGTMLQRSLDARLLVSVSDGLNSTWVESEPFHIR